MSLQTQAMKLTSSHNTQRLCGKATCLISAYTSQTSVSTMMSTLRGSFRINSIRSLAKSVNMERVRYQRHLIKKKRNDIIQERTRSKV